MFYSGRLLYSYFFFLLLLILFPATGSAINLGANDWSISATNTLRHDNYHNDGARAASPYFTSGGGKTYNEFYIDFSREFNPWKKASGQFYGVISDSEYRHTDEGFVPERFNVSFENGETKIPYRVEVGDYYSYLTYRTIQTSLKGATIELQPQSSKPGRYHSLMFFTGAAQPFYRDLDYADNYNTGASWLVEDPTLGRVSFNLLHNHTDGDSLGTVGLLDGSYYIGSVAIEKPFTVGKWRLNFEGEAAQFYGDDGNTALTRDNHSPGYFAQLSGRGLDNQPFDYRLRFEQYGQHFVPSNTVIIPNRQSVEGHIGWRLKSGLQLRARYQHYSDGYESANEQDTELIGANLSGQFIENLADDINGRIDVYQQSITDDFRTIDQETHNLTFNFNKPIAYGYIGQFDGFFQYLNDKTIVNGDLVTRQLSFSVNKGFNIGTINGFITPGLVAREFDGRGNNIFDSLELHPTLALNINKDNHRLSANYGLLNQNRRTTGLADISTQTVSFDYVYTMGIHEFGLNADFFDQDVNLGTDTEARRVGLYWTVRLNKPAGTSELNLAESSKSLIGSSYNDLLSADLGLLTKIVPGSRMLITESRLEEAGISGGTSFPRAKTYEISLINNIIQRQRLVLDHHKGKLNRSALLIDFDDIGSGFSMQEVFADVRDKLVKAYGNPSNVFEKGRFSNNVMNDINTGRLIRIMEWDTPDGVIRFGIPRRLDGIVRMEVHHASSFSSPRDTLWGVNVR